jgi:hypothetical protein
VAWPQGLLVLASAGFHHHKQIERRVMKRYNTLQTLVLAALFRLLASPVTPQTAPPGSAFHFDEHGNWL